MNLYRYKQIVLRGLKQVNIFEDASIKDIAMGIYGKQTNASSEHNKEALDLFSAVFSECC